MITGGNSLTFQVEPKNRDCFYVDLRLNQEATLNYFITRGGLLDIELQISGPNGQEIFSGFQYEGGEQKFRAVEPGPHEICWNNGMSRWTAKVVQFDVVLEGEGLISGTPAKDGSLQPLDESLNKLTDMMDLVEKDQRYLRIREQKHRDTAESTNVRVLWYSIFESVILFIISFGQVFYLRKFFEVKRTV